MGVERPSARNVSFLTSTPKWVVPPLGEPGSIDPLGYQAEADAIADRLLPGVTVVTRRARYLSFLVWAISENGDNPSEIDRWEVALSYGERLRHEYDGADCIYLGRRLMGQIDEDGGLRPNNPVRNRLHKVTAYRIYRGLASSCGLIDENGELTENGQKLAGYFGRYVPHTKPALVRNCWNMPCISEIGRKEQKLLRHILLKAEGDAQHRRATYRQIGAPQWRRILREGSPRSLLRQYLRKSSRNDTQLVKDMKDAAKLELEALPLTALFLNFYKTKSSVPRRIRTKSFEIYTVRPDPPALFSDVLGHLRRLSRLGGKKYPLDIHALRQIVLERHLEAKADAPWVNQGVGQSWRVMRYGLAPSAGPPIHAYRLTAFASLLRDIEVIR